MREARDNRSTTGGRRGILLVVALLAVGAAGMTEGPRPVGAAEPAPTADAQETTGPGATADCGRGVNLSFQEPNIHPAEMRWVSEYDPTDKTGVTGWYTNLTGTNQDKIQILRGSDGLQGVVLPANTPHKLSQSFPTLQGDRIAWAIRYGQGNTKRTDTLTIGAPGATPTTLASMSGDWKVYPATPSTYEVTHTAATSELAINAPGANDYALVGWVKLDLRCGISVTGTAAVTGDKAPTDVAVDDEVEFTYVVTNAADPASAKGAATLKNLEITETAGLACVRRPGGQMVTRAGQAVPATTLLKPGETIKCTATRDIPKTTSTPVSPPAL